MKEKEFYITDDLGSFLLLLYIECKIYIYMDERQAL